jgi:hypothetical protein
MKQLIPLKLATLLFLGTTNVGLRVLATPCRARPLVHLLALAGDQHYP